MAAIQLNGGNTAQWRQYSLMAAIQLNDGNTAGMQHDCARTKNKWHCSTNTAVTRYLPHGNNKPVQYPKLARQRSGGKVTMRLCGPGSWLVGWVDADETRGALGRGPDDEVDESTVEARDEPVYRSRVHTHILLLEAEVCRAGCKRRLIILMN